MGKRTYDVYEGVKEISQKIRLDTIKESKGNFE